MLLSLMLAAGLTSLIQAPTDERGRNGLRCLRSIDPSIPATRDEGCRQSPTCAALVNYVEGAGVVVEVEQAAMLRDGMTGALRSADPDPVVVVRVENPHGLEAPALGGAQELATEIYERAGVSLRWTVDETMEPDRTFTVVLDEQRRGEVCPAQRRDGRRAPPRRRHPGDARLCLPQQGAVFRRAPSPRRHAGPRVRPGARDRSLAVAAQRALAQQRDAGQMASVALSVGITQTPGIHSRSGEAAPASRAQSVRAGLNSTHAAPASIEGVRRTSRHHSCGACGKAACECSFPC